MARPAWSARASAPLLQISLAAAVVVIVLATAAWSTAQAQSAEPQDTLTAGREALEAEDYTTAFETLQPLAESGDRDAAFLVGLMLAQGLGRDADADAAAAAAWFERAAAPPNPHPQALFNLGVQYETGDGVEADLARAIDLYTQAAERGAARAMYNLAVQLVRGVGVERDLDAAMRWFLAAAQSGHQGAADALAQLGRDAGRDPALSGRWQAVDYQASPEHASWSQVGRFVPPLMGLDVRLTTGGFRFGAQSCGAPIYIAEETPWRTIATSLSGATWLNLPHLPADAALTQTTIICDGRLVAAVVHLPDGRALGSALGGVLVLDPRPSPNVADAQAQLSAAGYAPGPADGIYGPNTGAALKAFQAENGLTPTGALDPATLAALSAATETPRP